MSATISLTRRVRRSLFAGRGDTVLTLVLLPLCAWVAYSLGHWALMTADWTAVSSNIKVMLVGTFPPELLPRAWAWMVILCVLVGLTLMSTRIQVLRRWLGGLWFLGLIGTGVLLMPAGFDKWGGLMLGVLVTLLSSALSIPLGFLLAFGRRSKMAGLRAVCIGYIEVMRSLPLILIVYWIWIVTPLVAPGYSVPDVLRGLLGFSLFFAAYVAEYVRSGFQAVPKGQTEAAASLGMTQVQINRDVVLPQALRVVMPALVGNVLDIFNNVPLLFIIGLTEFLRAGQMVLANPQSASKTYEIYSFMFIVYLGTASLITYGARRLEARMAAGYR